MFLSAELTKLFMANVALQLTPLLGFQSILAQLLSFGLICKLDLEQA